MATTVEIIPLTRLAISLIPVAGLIAILYLWSLNAVHAAYGVVRMLAQLLLIGYALAFIFETHHASVILAVLIVMVTAASWIAVGNVAQHRLRLFGIALGSIVIAGGATLALVTQVVLTLPVWFSPQYVVPLAGMLFATSMNCVSLAVERVTSELDNGLPYKSARSAALNAALIPSINSLFAVGLVSLPGMMTGQILSGVDPFVAARYQILVMCMLLTAGGFSAVLFLLAARPIIAPGSHHTDG